ncbi:phage terminase small subunit P27 family [Shouchella lehensis]|uniref:Phage terminase-like protein, small subunit n=1 Tax=Shouchella lehensis G1 TaxID=1246626 RepID=A0A060LW19_9BACI|nr:phage terminase small subunit P27 family [Shouchella lehensis]AIC95451.1 phage terminase-like protein, small subunit [Shouchella lehensis G1]
MGRNAKPIDLHLVGGNKSRKTKEEIDKRKKGEEQVKFKSDNIVVPNWLSDQGKQIFEQLLVEFKYTDLLVNVDTHLLGFFCDAMDDYINISEIIRLDGYSDGEGNVNQLLTKKKHSFDQAMKVASQFGLSPTDRAKLAMSIVTKEVTKDDGGSFSGRI